MPFGLVSRRIDLLPGQPGPEPIRLDTLVLLRWVAIAGQLGVPLSLILAFVAGAVIYALLAKIQTPVLPYPQADAQSAD